MDDLEKTQPKRGHSKRFWILTGAAVVTVLAIGLGVGLGVGLTRKSQSDSDSDSDSNSGSATGSSPNPTFSNTTTTNTTNLWQPAAGASWQIVLQSELNDTSVNASVYDIDLFTNPTSTIQELHSLGRKVICYFSAGSYEPYRPDSSNFTDADKGKVLVGWEDEYWLNTKSDNVRNIMSARIELAASKGCDGIDPDNVDGYNNENGLGLTPDDAVNYLTFLADKARSLNLAIGLKNAGEIVDRVLGIMAWQVNEQCVDESHECPTFQPFIDAGKPVFHIEYPKSAPDVDTKTIDFYCNDSGEKGFSTVLKNMDLDEWVYECPSS